MPLPGATVPCARCKTARCKTARCERFQVPWPTPGGDPAVLASQEHKAEECTYSAIPPFNTATLLQYGHPHSMAFNTAH